jgi:tetratricopeptide (TPR) repeat protein
VGTTLKVTPKINNNGTIQMTVHPEVSSVSTTVDAGPVITTREADTSVLVKDGETLIIAGLLQTQDDLNKSRIPFLGSIPIIGALFSSRDKDKEQKELVIFMTPRILNLSGKTANPSLAKEPSEIELSGERVNAIEMFDKAQDLENGTSLQARVFPVGVRLSEAAQIYERISVIFPDNYYAQIGLYRAGRLYESKLGEYAAAISCYGRIIEKYPKSAYAREAENRINKIIAAQTKRKSNKKK